MKRVKNILTTKEEVAKVRQALEDKTREAFDRFDKARQACARQWMIAPRRGLYETPCPSCHAA